MASKREVVCFEPESRRDLEVSDLPSRFARNGLSPLKRPVFIRVFRGSIWITLRENVIEKRPWKNGFQKRFSEWALEKRFSESGPEKRLSEKGFERVVPGNVFWEVVSEKGFEKTDLERLPREPFLARRGRNLDRIVRIEEAPGYVAYVYVVVPFDLPESGYVEPPYVASSDH